MTAERTAELRGGWWGFSGFQVTGMIKWGQISKPKKVPRASNKTQKTPWTLNNPKKSHAKFLSLKNIFGKESKFGCTLIAEQCGRDMQALSWIFRLFWIAKKNLYLSSHPKKYLPNFPTPKNPRIKNFRPKKNLSIIPVTWNPVHPPLPSRAAEYLVKRILQGFWISHPQEIA